MELAEELDAAFIAVVNEIRRRVGTRLPVVVGGRSMGARVAARTAGAVGATVVVVVIGSPPVRGRGRS